jgi:hypothetical protein
LSLSFGEKNMRNFTFLLMLISTISYGSESYQLNSAIGNWITTDGVFAYYGLAITKSDDEKTLLLKYCEKFDLEMSGVCKLIFEYSGSVTYNGSSDDLRVSEAPHSPTPAYSIQIDKNDSGILKRTWGNQIIEYFRVN